ARRARVRSSARAGSPSSAWRARSSTGCARRWPVPAETHVSPVPLGPDEVLALVRERLAEILEIDAGPSVREPTFAGHPAADPLALIELVEVVEEELGERTVGFSVDDEDLADLRTVGDAVDYVVARLRAVSEAG